MTDGSFIYDPKKRCYVRAPVSASLSDSRLKIWRGRVLSTLRILLWIGLAMAALWLAFDYLAGHIGSVDTYMQDAPQLNLTR